MDQSHKKVAIFIIAFIIFFLGGVLLNSGLITWSTHSSLMHSLLQSIATVFALFVGAAALYRFYTEATGNYMLLFIGVGFIGTTVIDAYHTMVTASWFIKMFPNVPHTVIEWSWLSTRLFLALLLLFSLFGLSREKSSGSVPVKGIYYGLTILTLFVLGVFIFVTVPMPLYPEKLIARPLELIPGVVFLITLIGYLWKGNWKTDELQFWIVLFLIASMCTQFFYIDLSKRAHDLLYIGAHAMKIVSYAFVYLGVTSK